MATVKDFINEQIALTKKYCKITETITYTVKKINLDDVTYEFVHATRKHPSYHKNLNDYFIVFNGKRSVVTGDKKIFNNMTKEYLYSIATCLPVL